MNKLLALALAIMMGSFVGCETKSGTAPSTDPGKPNATQKLSITATDSHSITQDKTVEFMVDVTRTNFKEPVEIAVTDLPKGVTVDTKDLTVPTDKSRLTITLKAAPDAPPITDHVFHITGKSSAVPTTEPKAIKLTVKAK
ncbi:MAG TPA: hypothetical protein VHR66_10990 [Gemmataceae bacterium]|nr:hypothetical protein [Gemmataceae bacterium]